MRGFRPAATLALGVLCAQVAAASIFEQSYIYPERAGQSKVRWRNYDWQYTDFLTEEDGQGGVRLYYYDREKDAAELAGAAITEEYKHLKQTFGIVPDIRMPYILYASHLEFEEQNLFDISEAILGVTSPQDLTLSLPVLGRAPAVRRGLAPRNGPPVPDPEALPGSAPAPDAAESHRAHPPVVHRGRRRVFRPSRPA